ncbi:MAG TPA: hypothetical protein ENN46_03100 [Candidatus Woesearchaeota archaeon]|nr:hypothetical protein [Candidatus Woesearchaeota archaeon]
MEELKGNAEQVSNKLNLGGLIEDAIKGTRIWVDYRLFKDFQEKHCCEAVEKLAMNYLGLEKPSKEDSAFLKRTLKDTEHDFAEYFSGTSLDRATEITAYVLNAAKMVGVCLPKVEEAYRDILSNAGFDPSERLNSGEELVAPGSYGNLFSYHPFDTE